MLYSMPRPYVFWGTDNEPGKKNPPLFSSRKCSETVEKQAYSCYSTVGKKKPPQEILRLPENLQKPLGKPIVLHDWPATIQERPKRTWAPDVDAHEGNSRKLLEFLRFPVGAGSLPWNTHRTLGAPPLKSYT